MLCPDMDLRRERKKDNFTEVKCGLMNKLVFLFSLLDGEKLVSVSFFILSKISSVFPN